MTKEDFCQRFVDYMTANAGFETFNFGMPVREYAEAIAVSYYNEEDQRADGPEACADADMDCWEAE